MNPRRPGRQIVPEGTAATDGFLRGHQVARVLGMAIPLAMILVWWGVWGTTGKVKSVSETTAVVIRADERICLVRVVTGEEVRLFRPRNVREGMTVRMTRTEYHNGELRFELVTR